MFVRGVFFLFFLVVSFPALAQEVSLNDKCRLLYERTAFCPDDVCRLTCFSGKTPQECVPFCQAKPCEELDVERCLEGPCEIMTGCTGEEVCFSKSSLPPESCGQLGYYGDAFACCEGLQKRCGVEFFDGSCDMEGKQSIYGVAICIPCGNGICNQFENACNCPEDCKKEKKTLPIPFQ